jgi:phytoene synthase
MGVAPDDEDTLDRACDLGLAFQLANIARDLADDAAARCYLPAEWLAEHDVPPGEQMKPPYRATMRGWPRGCANGRRRTAVRRGSARRLAPRQRWAILAAAGIYGEIAVEVARRGAKAWDSRTVVGKGRKIAWIGKAGAALLPVPRPAMPARRRGASPAAI